MTVSRQPDPAAASEVVVRPYADGDYDAGRSLWAELTEYHRSIYGDPSIGPQRGRQFRGAGFTALGGHVDLTMDLAPRRHEWLPGASLHGLDFDY